MQNQVVPVKRLGLQSEKAILNGKGDHDQRMIMINERFCKASMEILPGKIPDIRVFRYEGIIIKISKGVILYRRKDDRGAKYNRGNREEKSKIFSSHDAHDKPAIRAPRTKAFARQTGALPGEAAGANCLSCKYPYCPPRSYTPEENSF